MSISLLKALTDHYDVVESAATDPSIVVPSDLDYTPGPEDDLGSMIWVLTYAIMLRHQESLQGSKKAQYKLKVIDTFYGSSSYSGLALLREGMMFRGISSRAKEPEKWIPDPPQSRWFRRAMTLLASQHITPFYGSIKAITFDAFDALCDEFVTDE